MRSDLLLNQFAELHFSFSNFQTCYAMLYSVIVFRSRTRHAPSPNYRVELSYNSPLCLPDESCLRLQFTTHSTPFQGCRGCGKPALHLVWRGREGVTHTLCSFHLNSMPRWGSREGEREREEGGTNGNCDKTKSKKILHKKNGKNCMKIAWRGVGESKRGR